MTGPYTAIEMSTEIGTGDVGTGRFDSVYAEAKSALGYAANTLRALTEQYREAYHADLSSWHAEHDELDREELDALGAIRDDGTGSGESTHAGELRQTVALGASELGERGTELRDPRDRLGNAHLGKGRLGISAWWMKRRIGLVEPARRQVASVRCGLGARELCGRAGRHTGARGAAR